LNAKQLARNITIVISGAIVDEDSQWAKNALLIMCKAIELGGPALKEIIVDMTSTFGQAVLDIANHKDNG
jgi:urease accessory protein UreF